MAKGTFGERIQVTWAWGDEVGANAAPLQRHTISCTFPQSGTMRVSIIYGAKPSVGKAFHGYCDGEYVYGPLLTA